MNTEPLSAEEIIRRIERAEQEVFDLCSGKRRWTMTVPAEENRDSDLLIGGALAEARKFLATLDAARPVPAGSVPLVTPEEAQQYGRESEAADRAMAVPAGDEQDRLAALRDAVIHAARDVDGLWWPQDDNFTGTDLTFWGPEAGEALRDLRTAVGALDDAENDTPIRTVTTPDGQVYRPDCGAHHPDHPGTRCRQPEGHSGEHATARRDVTWDNAYLSAPEGK